MPKFTNIRIYTVKCFNCCFTPPNVLSLVQSRLSSDNTEIMKLERYSTIYNVSGITGWFCTVLDIPSQLKVDPTKTFPNFMWHKKGSLEMPTGYHLAVNIRLITRSSRGSDARKATSLISCVNLVLVH